LCLHGVQVECLCGSLFGACAARLLSLNGLAAVEPWLAFKTVGVQQTVVVNLSCYCLLPSLLLLLLLLQVMSPELMYRHPAVFAGRPLNFREASFLGNGRTPSWVRHAATAISSGTPLGCEGGAKCAQALLRKPPEGVNQQVRRGAIGRGGGGAALSGRGLALLWREGGWEGGREACLSSAGAGRGAVFRLSRCGG
jgi:hypothetical protein